MTVPATSLPDERVHCDDGARQETVVLGVDLACRSWEDNGTALLAFQRRPAPRWTDVRLRVLSWPPHAPTVRTMADVIDQFARKNAIAAVSLDGPQGWRALCDVSQKRGVGRACERAAGTPGKTGPLSVAYPGTWLRWVEFSIGVFDELLRRPHVRLVNDESVPLAPMSCGRYYLLECFPTSTWRSLGLDPLPGHRRAPPPVVRRYFTRLGARLGLPPTDADVVGHDDLQALVAALPAAAVLGAPCRAVARGAPGSLEASGTRPPYRVEGLIWDAALPSGSEAPREPPEPSEQAGDADNPVLPDDRDPEGEAVLARGVRLFRRLVRLAERGQAVGVGYAQFVEACHSRPFRNVAGRPYRNFASIRTRCR